MTIIDSIILGITQGLSEFLPISSSAHLLIASHIRQIEDPSISFGIFVHFATLMSVLIYFFDSIRDLFVSFAKSFGGVIKERRLPDDEKSRQAWLILIATIPTGFIGIAFHDFFEKYFTNGWHVGVFLIITGMLLLLSARVSSGKKRITGFSLLDSILVGLAQSLAIFPGISRSGATISTALLRGLNREVAAQFSFLLSIPVILGAMLIDISKTGGLSYSLEFLIGGFSAFLSGLAAISIFMYLIKNRKYSMFAYYCFAVGIIIFVSYTI